MEADNDDVHLQYCSNNATAYKDDVEGDEVREDEDKVDNVEGDEDVGEYG